MGQLVQHEAEEERRDQEKDAKKEKEGIAEHSRPGLLDLDATGARARPIGAGAPPQVMIDGGLDTGGELLAGAYEVNLGLRRDHGLKPFPEGALGVEFRALAVRLRADGFIPWIPPRRWGFEIGEDRQAFGGGLAGRRFIEAL
jgi:hypothetical protein